LRFVTAEVTERSVAAELSSHAVAAAPREVRQENPARASTAYCPPSQGPVEEALRRADATTAPTLTPRRGPVPASAASVPLMGYPQEREAPVLIVAPAAALTQARTAAVLTIRWRGLAPASPRSFPSKAMHQGLASPEPEQSVAVDEQPVAEQPAVLLGVAARTLWPRDSGWPLSGPSSDSEQNLLIPGERPRLAQGFWALPPPPATASPPAACVALGASPEFY
jgi:hypothetical protein